ncbi:Rho GTPase activation protein [Hysterangium stoloniferum]|nr:Rho GTPase activation protein [Hysterangium stoloniferum]
MANTGRPESPPPSKASLKAWWRHFTTAQRMKKPSPERGGSKVFGVPLRDSLQYASVQISTASVNGDLYVWGYIPVTVAKCGLHLKENATEISGTFRVNGSAKRMRDLQALFEEPPRFGKNLDLKQGHFTTHDVASIFRRYLTMMPEPVIPHDLYHDVRRLSYTKIPYNQDECIQTFKRLIRSMPRANQYLLLYVLDLLSVFARKSDQNLMTAANLAVIFRPGILSHPDHELSPDQHKLSQDVLEFLIAHQDWFLLDIPPPPSSVAGLSPAGGDSLGESPVLVTRPSDDEWKAEETARGRGRDERDQKSGLRPRRRATSVSERLSGLSTPTTPSPRQSTADRGGLVEGYMGEMTTLNRTASVNVTRSRTLPPARARIGEGGGTASGDERQRKVLRKKNGRTHAPPQKDDLAAATG